MSFIITILQGTTPVTLTRAQKRALQCEMESQQDQRKVTPLVAKRMDEATKKANIPVSVKVICELQIINFAISGLYIRTTA